MTAEELLERYAAGERDFSGVDLTGADLTKGILCDGVYLENTTMPDGEVVVEGIGYIFWFERKFKWDWSN